MSPSKRDREYAKRRYSDWQTRQAAKASRSRRLRIIASTIFAVIAIGTIVTLVVIAARPPDPETTPADAASEPTSQSETTNPCPVPTDIPYDQKSVAAEAPSPAEAGNKEWTVELTTTCGAVTLSLDGAKAPQSVSNFLFLTREKFFDETSCHRLTTENVYVLQCGDTTGQGNGDAGYRWGPIENAPSDNVYPAGTIAMARKANEAGSQGSQFFIVYKDSTIPSDTAGGYSVFGTVTSGLDVIEKVAEGGTVAGGSQPNRPIAIESAEIK